MNVQHDVDAGRMVVTVPAHPEQVTRLRSAAREFAEHHGVAAPDDVALAISEAATNAVMHAYPKTPVGAVRLTAARGPAMVTFDVEDHGCGLRPHPGGSGAGLGLRLMNHLAQCVAIRARPGGGTIVSLTFPAELGAAGGDGAPASVVSL